MTKQTPSRRSISVGILLVAAITSLTFLSRRSRVNARIEFMEVSGLRREYRLVLPQSLNDQHQPPLVVALHGAIDRTEEMAEHTGFDELAAEHEFALVYLQGRHLNWPPLIPPENPDAMRPDFEFFNAICRFMVERHNVDARRIYVVGVSQGGSMANAITAFCSDRVAATICNCGWLPDPLGESPIETNYKSPMLFIAGERDNQVSPAKTREAHDAFAASGHPVEYLEIPNHGHGWPRDKGINEVAWQFLAKQRQPSSHSWLEQEELSEE